MQQQTTETTAKLKNSNTTIGGMASSNGKPGPQLDSVKHNSGRMPTMPQKPLSKDDDGYLEENEDDDNEDEDTFADKDETDGGGGFVEGSRNDQISVESPLGQKGQGAGKSFRLPESMSQLAMPLPLVAAGHSLLPDMQFGWKPQADKEIPPIPLCFGQVYYNLEQFNYPKVLYVGPRFQNSYKMHEQFANKLMKLPIQTEDGGNNSIYAYPFTFPKFYDSSNCTYEEAFNSFVESLEFDYSLMDQNLNFKIPEEAGPKNGLRANQNTMLTALSFKDEREEMVFDSNFESGNLDFVGKVQDNEYDLLMRLDSNSRSHQQWFYFSLDCKEIRRRSTKGETVKINILNFTKPNSLYNQGMRPVAWSKQKRMVEGVGWHRVGQNIQYRISKLCRQNQNGYSSGRTWYQMSFEYTIEFDQDKIWFAYAIPYSFTMLTNFIKAIEEVQKRPENVKNNIIFKKEVLGKSLSGIEIPLLTITDFSETNKRKKTIVMVGRLHPGETHSSWLIHGFIRFLLSESPKARELRKKVVFKIVPMLNPDGVIMGNYRCSLAGCDMNRNFGGDSEVAQRLNPETALFKKMAKQQSRTAFFFDVHAHSSKKSIFIYGPYFPLHSEHYLKIRIMPRLLSEKTQMFRYYSCRFRNEAHKMHCSRLTIYRECNLPQCYTIETSIMGFLNKERQNVSFGIPSLQYFGEKFGETLLEWFQIIEAHQREKIKKAIIMSKQRKTRKRTIIDIIGEEDYLEFRDVIDDQLEQQQQEELAAENLAKKAALAAANKGNSSTKKSKKSKTKMTRRKTLTGSNDINNGQGSPNQKQQNPQQNIIAELQQLGLVNEMPESSTSGMVANQVTKVLDTFQVNLQDYKKQQSLPSKKQNQNQPQMQNQPQKQIPGAVDTLSSEQEEEEDEDDCTNAANSGVQTLKPKLEKQVNPDQAILDSLARSLEPNRGYFIPKLAGFEYLEGPEHLQQQAKQLRTQLLKQAESAGKGSYGLANSRANNDIMFSTSDVGAGGQNAQMFIDDDDEGFIQEDQAMQQKDNGTEPLRRLEDIVGEIRKDLIKAANVSGVNAANASHNSSSVPGLLQLGELNDNNQQQQLYDEKDLDSQRSDADNNDPNNLDAEYDTQMRKMQECLTNYFENVEELRKNPYAHRQLAKAKQQSSNKQQQQPPPLQQPQPPITVIIKENKPKPSNEPSNIMAGQPFQSKISPTKQQRISVVVEPKKQPEVLIPQRKEIVFQLKKPTITNFPPEKPRPTSTHVKHQPLNQMSYAYMQNHRGSNSPPHQFQQGANPSTQNLPLDPKDLSYTLMHRTNQEFFDLLSKYVQTKGPLPNGVGPNAIGQIPQENLKTSQNTKNPRRGHYQRASSAYPAHKQKNLMNKSGMSSMSKPQLQTQYSMQQNMLTLQQQQQMLQLIQQQQQAHQNIKAINTSEDGHISSRNPQGFNSRQGGTRSQNHVTSGRQQYSGVESPDSGRYDSSRNYGGFEKEFQPNINQSVIEVQIERMHSKANMKVRGSIGSKAPSQFPSQQNAHQYLQSRSEIESPQKRRALIEQAKVANAKSTNLAIQSAKKSDRHASGGCGNQSFVLMIDGRGVNQKISNTESKNKQVRQQMNNSLQIKSINQQLQPGGIYENIVNAQQSQIDSQSNKLHKQSHQSKSFVITKSTRSQGQFKNTQHARGQSSNNSDTNSLLLKMQKSQQQQRDQHSQKTAQKQSQNELSQAYQCSNHGLETSPRRHFMHVRHSSNFNNQQKETDQQNEQYSPTHVIPYYSNQTEEGSISPLKKLKGQLNIPPYQIQGELSNPIGISVINNKAFADLQKSTRQPVNFYHMKESTDEQCEDVDIDSARYYNQHLNNYFDDSATGLNLTSAIHEIGVSDGYLEESPHALRKPRGHSGGSRLGLQSSGNNNGFQRSGYGDNSLQESQEMHQQRLSSATGVYNIQPSYQQHYQNSVKMQPRAYKNQQSYQSQQPSIQLSEAGSSITTIQNSGALPMKNQLLIDMFRQANSHSSQAQERPRTYGLRPSEATLAHAQQVVAQQKQQQSNSSRINFLESKNANDRARLLEQMIPNNINISLKQHHHGFTTQNSLQTSPDKNFRVRIINNHSNNVGSSQLYDATANTNNLQSSSNNRIVVKHNATS